MKSLKFLASSALITFICASPQATHGMENPSGIQLIEAAKGKLEKIFGGRGDKLVKLTMDLKSIQGSVDQKPGDVKVPVKIFLTNAASSEEQLPTDLQVSVTVNCDPTLSMYLPESPPSFTSDAEYTKWLNGAYYTNNTTVTYDFHIDLDEVSPSLAEHLSSSPDCHFAGTYSFPKIDPDKRIPRITYKSERGSVNTTTVTLNAVLILKKMECLIPDHSFILAHSLTKEVLLKKDETTKGIYCHTWIRPGVITKATYEELPENLRMNWPTAPSERYTVERKTLGDVENVMHINCWDVNGNVVDISDGRAFPVVSEAISNKSVNFLERIVQDKSGNLYVVHYTSLKEPSTEEVERS